MTLRYCSRCSGTQDTRWKSQRAMSRAYQSPPSINSLCHRNPILQVKACFQEVLIIRLLTPLFFPFLPNFISYFLFFLNLWGYCVIVQATGRKLCSVITTVSLSDVPVKINAALRRCPTQSRCWKKWGFCVWRNWHLWFYCLEFLCHIIAKWRQNLGGSSKVVWLLLSWKAGCDSKVKTIIIAALKITIWSNICG